MPQDENTALAANAPPKAPNGVGMEAFGSPICASMLHLHLLFGLQRAHHL